MSDEKLDLILKIAADLSEKIDELRARADSTEFKTKVETISNRLDRLEKEIILNRTETLENRKRIRDFEERLVRLEEPVKVTA